MNDRCPIVRAAAVANGELLTLPPGLDRGGALEGGDALATAALRVMGVLLAGMSESARASMGLVIGTASGCIEMDRAFDQSRRDAGGRYASPAAFSRTLPSTIAAEMALRFGVKGPGLVVSAGHRSAAMALRRAAAWMTEFQLEYCVAGSAEWIGDQVRVALILLARQRSIGELHLAAFVADEANPGAIFDWISGSDNVDLGAGVRLVHAA